MNRTLFNVYSDVYTVALLRDIRQPSFVNKPSVASESRFGKLVKWIARG
ncbi:hypothetical protein [Aestuariivirga litoralis]|nr:hypothetical protein [Aestuariivirga litoralis]